MRRTPLLFALLLVATGAVSASAGQPRVVVAPAKPDPGPIDCVATYTYGTGDRAFEVCVSEDGNLTFSFGGVPQINGQWEGYAVCTGYTVSHGYDVGGRGSGFGPATITQPIPGSFPVSISRDTTDGVFRLTQQWPVPRGSEHEFKVEMTLTNLSSSMVDFVRVTRSGDYDLGGTPADDYGAGAGSSAVQFDLPFGENGNGVAESPLTARYDSSGGGVETAESWYSDGYWNEEALGACGSALTLIQSPVDLVSKAGYWLGSIGPGRTKSFTFEWHRL